MVTLYFDSDLNPIEVNEGVPKGKPTINLIAVIEIQTAFFKGLHYFKFIFLPFLLVSMDNCNKMDEVVMRQQICKVGVVGAGTMGSGIAQVFAQNGYEVFLYDSHSSQLEKAISLISKNLQRDVEKGRIDVLSKDKALTSIKMQTNLEVFAEVDGVIEAINENLELKNQLFKNLESICNNDIVLASNTSSISITQIAAKRNFPERVVGMHFMNPVPAMKLVEIIKGLHTSAETVEIVRNLVVSLGKTPVEVNDAPGFISNRLLIPMINEAIFCLYEGIANKESIDTVMKLGMNHPMGPLALADLIGLDICLNIMETLYLGYNDSKYRPCPLLKKMVEAGILGRKSGEGFYKYSE